MMNMETEIKTIKAQMRFLTGAYFAGLVINVMSFAGILIAILKVF